MGITAHFLLLPPLLPQLLKDMGLLTSTQCCLVRSMLCSKNYKVDKNTCVVLVLRAFYLSWREKNKVRLTFSVKQCSSSEAALMEVKCVASLEASVASCPISPSTNMLCNTYLLAAYKAHIIPQPLVVCIHPHKASDNM